MFRISTPESLRFGPATFALAGSEAIVDERPEEEGEAAELARTKVASASEWGSLVSNFEFIDQVHHAEQATIATGVIYRGFAHRNGYLRHFRMGILTTGSAGQTDVVVKINGSTVSNTGVISNADPDGTLRTIKIDSEITERDYLEIEVTAAPTGGADLFVDVPQMRDFGD